MTRYHFAYVVSKALFTVVHPMEVVGRENIPTGAAVICPNHAFNSDPFYAVYAFDVDDQINVMAKEEILHWPVVSLLLRWLNFVIWVKRGKADIAAVKSALKCLKRGEKLLIFPEGTRHEEIGEGKTGAAMLAVRSGVPVLPLYLSPERRAFHRTRIIIGEPYQPFAEERRANAEDYKTITQDLMERIRALERPSEETK